MTQVNTNGDGLEMLVGVEKVIYIDRSELNVVADKDGDATPSSTLAITSKEGEARERWVRVIWTQLCVLQTPHLYVVLTQERREFSL